MRGSIFKVSRRSCCGLRLAVFLLMGVDAHGAAVEKIDCPKNPPKIPAISRSQVYKDVPFKAGENARYEVKYMGILAGYGDLVVKPPTKLKGVWHRVFHADARTGDWYKMIFVAHDIISAFSRPWDFGISRFYMKQSEGKMLGSTYRREKWLEFNHEKCVVHEKVKFPGKDAELKDVEFSYGGIDSLGSVFKLRAMNHEVGKTKRFVVYTSEKNWYLEAKALANEKITVPAGTFDTVKLKLQTFIGQELQQKGDVYAWVATKDPSRQLVKVEGEIKIGAVDMLLHRFKAGR